MVYRLTSLTGLSARIATAAAAGLKNTAGAAVASAADMKEGITNLLCSAPDEGVDLGEHHDTLQFLPNYRMLAKVDALLRAHPYLQRHAKSCVPLIPSADQWPDVVDALRCLAVTSETAAFGPVDLRFVFNL